MPHSITNAFWTVDAAHPRSVRVSVCPCGRVSCMLKSFYSISFPRVLHFGSAFATWPLWRSIGWPPDGAPYCWLPSGTVANSAIGPRIHWLARQPYCGALSWCFSRPALGRGSSLLFDPPAPGQCAAGFSGGSVMDASKAAALMSQGPGQCQGIFSCSVADAGEGSASVGFADYSRNRF